MKKGAVPSVLPSSPIRLKQDLHTHRSILIDQHYEGIGLDKGWASERVIRLASMLNVTPYELGVTYLIHPFTMFNMLKTNSLFPGTMALHFALLESWWFEKACGLKSRPIVPLNILSLDL